jgi:hypothetical protein
MVVHDDKQHGPACNAEDQEDSEEQIVPAVHLGEELQQVLQHAVLLLVHDFVKGWSFD